MNLFRTLSQTARCLGAASVLIISPLSGPAADLNWTGNGGTFFQNAGNWDPSQSPTADDNLTFDANANRFDLNLSGNPQANELRFLGGSYTMEGGPLSDFESGNAWVDGGILTATGLDTQWMAGINTSVGDITVGDLTDGTLNLEAGAFVSHYGLFLGQTSLGNGTVNVSGASSRLGTSNQLSIGRVGVNGMGTMNISAGGKSNMSSA